MKNLFLLFITLNLSFCANSQIAYNDTINYVIDLSVGADNSDIDTLELDFDQDGNNDMRITSWANHIGDPIESAVEIIMIGNNGNLKPHLTSSFAPKCPNNAQFDDSNNGGYLYYSDELVPYSGIVKIPFRYNLSTIVSYGILYVNYQVNIVTIEAYAWNQTPGGYCDCNSTASLGLEDLSTIENLGEFKYYNLMGQEVQYPSGLVLKVYESGLSQKVYISN